MTPFEITIITLLAIIMLMVIILVKTAIGRFHDVLQQLNANWEQLRKIETHLDVIFNTVDHIRNNQFAEIAIREANKQCPSNGYNTPCYAPDGICTNSLMDCINCPKRGTGGTWSTSTNLNKKGGKDEQ